MNRRDLLKTIGFSGLGALAPMSFASRRSTGSAGKVTGRFAFLTDCHLPVSGKNDAVRRALRMAQTRFGSLDFIFFGGDNIYAADGPNQKDTTDQLSNWKSVVSGLGRLPTYSVIGNHDIWGINSPDPRDRLTGKRMAQQAFGMPDRYYAFSRNGWRFIALDTVQQFRVGYYGNIDRPQFDWLVDELKSHPEPTIIIGHIPILSVSGIVANHHPARVSHSQIVSNASDLVELFRVHKQVKLCLSGHMHMVDYTKFHHTEYLCAGAVSGGWWKGPHEHFLPNFSVIEMLDNESLSFRNVKWAEISAQK